MYCISLSCWFGIAYCRTTPPGIDSRGILFGWRPGHRQGVDEQHSQAPVGHFWIVLPDLEIGVRGMPLAVHEFPGAIHDGRIDRSSAGSFLPMAANGMSAHVHGGLPDAGRKLLIREE